MDKVTSIKPALDAKAAEDLAERESSRQALEQLGFDPDMLDWELSWDEDENGEMVEGSADLKLPFRCGDHVRHEPSGEVWLVAFADYGTGELSAFGWPESLARIADCVLVQAATDVEHAGIVRELVKAGGMRGARAARLYPKVANA